MLTIVVQIRLGIHKVWSVPLIEAAKIHVAHYLIFLNHQFQLKFGYVIDPNGSFIMARFDALII